ncbi:hypothetical protein A2331_06935 [Candidatus Falkowbacteria bacterium RIFOXYB2_FULL_34_18]|uniref:Uncharacterized protein n=1 Tax=Candidatus Falkowbacteria bacterium RIFOXYD2_FULL_34_120 TaxID=1798007 RepID=A0A1F5TRW6_9BACT|nr:MAG: hypothetical protein A2331_06935 [Candidatus Falkowbacteria bacterium RIFOXYB2_FULL_34_18]OGF29943.1 MAG: hypothetical protein A2500_03740 [Candidatus Falkowbacteria bacterium RIFOXYC12_FULL_34_55]OGF39481.1 MAG: hypothetical protein A2515_04115 [Candidatus Falkowbacteria bacterium RIFOXYD12_FULL_34_57]OGF41537.1 MAG: hypothetical protein A2531_02490 [Candidatus Falkowbacteria bacterium RIFOXYD2_FULL_34_120]
MENTLQGNMNQNISLGQNRLKEEDIVIHTMPKIFSSVFGVNKSGEKAKSVGLFVLIGGIFLLICVLGFFYYFLTKGEKITINEQGLLEITKNVQPATTGKDQELTPKEISSASQVIPEKNQQEVSKILEEKATSTLEILESNTENPQITTSTPPQKATSTIPKTQNRIVVDTDQDGLSDIEEVILGSNANLKDSDGDGYADLTETLGLYNPAGEGNILVNSSIEKYTNSKYKYSLYYSSFWPIETMGGEESIMFKLNNNQFINIIIEPNEDQLNINEWYQKQFNNILIKPEQVVSKKGWTGIKSDDGLIVYLMHPMSNNIFVLSYNLGLEATENYKNIFKMMIESLRLEE